MEYATPSADADASDPNPICSEAFPNHLEQQLKALQNDPVSEHLHIYRGTPYSVTREGQNSIKWIIESTGEELSVRKYMSPTPFSVQKPGYQSFMSKPCCLVAKGGQLPRAALLHVVEVNRKYVCHVWDMDIYMKHQSVDGSDRPMLKVDRAWAGQPVRPKTMATKSSQKRRGVWGLHDTESEDEAYNPRRSLPLRRSRVDYTLQSSGDPASDLRIEGNNRLRNLQIPPTESHGAESANTTIIPPAAPNAKTPDDHGKSASTKIVDLTSGSSDDGKDHLETNHQDDSKASRAKDIRRHNTVFRFLNTEKQTMGPTIPLSEISSADKLLYNAAKQYVTARADMVLKLAPNLSDVKPVGIVQGEPDGYDAFVDAVLESDGWKMKKERKESNGKDMICYVDVTLL